MRGRFMSLFSCCWGNSSVGVRSDLTNGNATRDSFTNSTSDGPVMGQISDSQTVLTVGQASGRTSGCFGWMFNSRGNRSGGGNGASQSAQLNLAKKMISP